MMTVRTGTLITTRPSDSKHAPTRNQESQPWLDKGSIGSSSFRSSWASSVKGYAAPTQCNRYGTTYDNQHGSAGFTRLVVPPAHYQCIDRMGMRTSLDPHSEASNTRGSTGRYQNDSKLPSSQADHVETRSASVESFSFSSTDTDSFYHAQHLLDVAEAKPFSCPRCRSRFTTWQEMKKHIEETHTCAAPGKSTTKQMVIALLSLRGQ
mmetsp:Transcript_21074/g.39557  ORF Transcript_21074/g.39557 Transcript_21074/m.39557 type:complete len:208 (+) Transcript_21074:3-626(+)